MASNATHENAYSNYGTVSPRPAQNTRLFSSGDEERVDLLRSNTRSTSPPPFPKRLTSHFRANVSKTHGDWSLLFCYIITGLLDSSAVYTFGSFVSMQTGNTIYLGTGIMAPEGARTDRWIRALISIGAFCVGSFCFARFHRAFGERRRGTVVGSFFIQFVCVAASAVMVTIGPDSMTPEGPLTEWVIVPLVLIAFQSAGQAVISRVLKYNSLTSVVLTSIYCDLFSDEQFFAGVGKNVERNRRAGGVVLLLAGAMLGGVFAHRSGVGLAGALWLAAGMKGAVVVAWCFWAEEKEDDGEE